MAFVSPYQINQLRQQPGAIISSGEYSRRMGQQSAAGVAQPQSGGTQSTPVTGPIASAAGGTSPDASKQAALSRLNAVGSGQNQPVTAAQKAGMVSTQSDMSAAAEAQQNAALRRTTAAGGGSLYDPSHGAAERENASDRQAANQQAVRDIDMGAQAQNFEAEFAANRLLASQDTGGGGGGGYGTGSGPSSTPGADRVQGYGGMDLSQKSLSGTTSNGIRQPTTTTRQPTAGVQGQPTSGGPQSPADFLASDPYKKRRYDTMRAQGYTEQRALQLLGYR